MREWESHFTGDYGWPRYAEYRHALMPHGPAFTNADRMRAATEFSQDLLLHLHDPGAGTMPPRRGFLSISPANIHLLALRRKPGGVTELRVVEVEGQEATAAVKLDIPMASASLTDLIGNDLGALAPARDRLQFEVRPWKVATLAIR